jgi:hypothetical protein
MVNGELFFMLWELFFTLRFLGPPWERFSLASPGGYQVL